MTFDERKEATAADCEAVADMLRAVAAEIRKGDLRAFERFWIEGGTEEGDAKIDELRQRIAMRYLVREAEAELPVCAGPTPEATDE